MDAAEALRRENLANLFSQPSTTSLTSKHSLSSPKPYDELHDSDSDDAQYVTLPELGRGDAHVLGTAKAFGPSDTDEGWARVPLTPAESVTRLTKEDHKD